MLRDYTFLIAAAVCLLILGTAISYAEMNRIILPQARAPYAQISDLTTQACPVASAGNVTLDTNDGLYRINHSTLADTNEITIMDAGVYQVIAAPQVGETGGQGAGIHNFWMQKNGVTIPNSNIKTTTMIQVTGSQTMVGVLNWVGYLAAGDMVSFQQSCDAANLGIIFTGADVAPATPSVIVSVVRISP